MQKGNTHKNRPFSDKNITFNIKNLVLKTQNIATKMRPANERGENV